MVLSDDRGYHYCSFLEKMIRFPEEVHGLLEKHSKYKTIDEFDDAAAYDVKELSRADLQLEFEKMKELKAALRHQIDCYKHATNEFNKSADGVYMNLIQKINAIEKLARPAQMKQDAQESMDKKEAVRSLEELQVELSQIDTKVKLENEKSDSTARLWWVVSRYTSQLQKKLETIVKLPWPLQGMLKKVKRVGEEDAAEADPNAVIVSSPPSPTTPLPFASNPVACGTRGSIRRSAPISQRTRSKSRRI